MIVDAQKLPLSRRWRHRRAKAPKPGPPPIVPKVLTAIERNRIARWVAAQIITWPSDRCLGCKRPIIYGAKWTEVARDNDRARFHVTCYPEWLAQQEVAARRALGMNP
jgi:hypothetical protein